MSKDKLKVVGICGSLRKISYTRFSVNIALEAAEKMGAEVKLIDLRDYDLPFVEQFEEDDQPEDLRKYRDEVASADAIILGTPEYHGRKRVIQHIHQRIVIEGSGSVTNASWRHNRKQICLAAFANY